ncbi:MAG: YlbF family regulator [Clostridiaceae bacterium]|nr:YlbF family regulator [Clostridiaceae bacterium]
MDNIIEKAKELGEMLAESKQYIRLKNAEEAQLNDSKAQDLLKQYNQKRRQAAMLIRCGKLNAEQIESVKKELQEEFNRLYENENIKEYIEAKKDFEQLLNTINSILYFYIGEENKKGCLPGKCSTGTCRGC